jgi:hypothetical protein
MDHLCDEAFCKLLSEAVEYTLRTGDTAFAGFTVADIFEEYHGRAEQVRRMHAVMQEREGCAKAAESCQIIVYWEDGTTKVNGEGTRISAAESIRARENLGGE